MFSVRYFTIILVGLVMVTSARPIESEPAVNTRHIPLQRDLPAEADAVKGEAGPSLKPSVMQVICAQWLAMLLITSLWMLTADICTAWTIILLWLLGCGTYDGCEMCFMDDVFLYWGKSFLILVHHPFHLNKQLSQTLVLFFAFFDLGIAQILMILCILG